MSNIVDTFNKACDEIQAAAKKTIDNSTRGWLYAAMQKKHLEFTRANVRLVFFERYGREVPAGVMTSAERDEWQRNIDDANLSADDFKAKYALIAKNDRVTKDSLSPEAAAAKVIVDRNAAAVAKHKSEVAGAEQMAKASFVAMMTPGAPLGEWADQFQFADKITVRHKAMTPQELYDSGLLAVAALNQELEATGQKPATAHEVHLMIELAVAQGYFPADPDAFALFAAFKVLQSQGVIRRAAIAAPELEAMPETNPHEPSDSENSLYAKWDRAHAVTAGAQEISPVFNATVNEISAATGLGFPHACRKELLTAIDAARLPFTRENIRSCFFKIWGSQAKAAMTPEETATFEIEQDAKSMSAGDFAVKYGASSRGRW